MIHPVSRIWVLMTVTAAELFAADNFVGTWKLTATNDRPSQTEIWQRTPDGYKITATRPTKTGNGIAAARTIILDGKAHLSGGRGPAGTRNLNLTFTQTDAKTITLKGEDAVSMAGSFDGKWAVSSDGRTMTYTFHATGADGRPVTGTSIYTRP